jgi:L-threonylcarbamoyladenylate synthase
MLDGKLLRWNESSTIEKLKKSLTLGHVSITSTDTILGLLTSLTNKGYQALHTIKGSRSDKTYVILIASPQKLSHFIDEQSLNKNVRCLIEKCWPGPLTIVFKAKKDLPNYLVAADGTIALRCPKHDGLLTILSEFDGLFSTSANKSGQKVATTMEEMDSDIVEACDYIVVDIKETKAHEPSTIIDVSKEDVIKLVRQGAYSSQQLEEIIGIPIKKYIL